jgi:hypothetical protein
MGNVTFWAAGLVLALCLCACGGWERDRNGGEASTSNLESLRDFATDLRFYGRKTRECWR